MLGDVSPLLGERAFLVAQEAVDEVDVPEDVARAVVRIVRHTRESQRNRARREPAGVAPSADRREGARGRARAATSVELDDVAWLAPYVLSHRISASDRTPEEIVRSAVETGLGMP